MGSDFIDRIFPGCNQAALLELSVITLSADKEMALLVAKVTVTELSDDREPGTAILRPRSLFGSFARMEFS